MIKSLVQKVRELVGKLFSLKDTPHAIAGGVAIGMFMGFTPLFGLKTALSFGCAWLLRCSPVAALIAVSLHDIITPLWPVLLITYYKLGSWILHSGQPPAAVDPHHFHWTAFLKASTYTNFDWEQFQSITLPTLIGSVPFSVAGAVVAYFLTLVIVRRSQARRASA